MMDYDDVLRNLVNSEARKLCFERRGPQIMLDAELKRYEYHKSQLEKHPDRLPRAMELEIILKIIDERLGAKSYPLCPSCTHNQSEEVSVAYGKKWVAENHPDLSGSVAQEKEMVGFLSNLSMGIGAHLEKALEDFNPVICQKVKLRLEDQFLYICPHFVKDRHHDLALSVSKGMEEHDREALNEMRRNYRAELEKLSGIPPPRRI